MSNKHLILQDLNLLFTSWGTHTEERWVFLSSDSDSEEVRLIITGRKNCYNLLHEPLVFHLQDFHEKPPPNDDSENDEKVRLFITVRRITIY